MAGDLKTFKCEFKKMNENTQIHPQCQKLSLHMHKHTCTYRGWSIAYYFSIFSQVTLPVELVNAAVVVGNLGVCLIKHDK